MKLPVAMVSAGLPPEMPLADIHLLADWLIERGWYLWVWHEDYCLEMEADPKRWYVAAIGRWRYQLMFHPMPEQFNQDVAQWAIGIGATLPTYEECLLYSPDGRPHCEIPSNLGTEIAAAAG